MRSTTVTLLALLSSSVHSSPLAKRKDWPNEGVYLVSCSTVDQGPARATHDYVYWYNDDADGREGAYPGMTTTPNDPNLYHDEIYNINWSTGTEETPITADLRQGGEKKKFTLYDLKDGGVKQGERVKSKASLDDQDMDCYKSRISVPDSLENASLWKCVAQYRCTRQLHRSKVLELVLYNATTTISGFNKCGTGESANPYKGFGHYAEWASSKKPPGTPYSLKSTLGEECSISFSVEGVDADAKEPMSIKDVQQFWYKTIAPSVSESIIISPDSTVGAHPYCSITYPTAGYLSLKESQDSNTAIYEQKSWHFSVVCGKKKCDANPKVSVLTGILDAISAIPGAGALGAVTGILNAANAGCVFS